MKHSTLTILLGAALLFAGYLGGTIAGSSGGNEALAAPACNGNGSGTSYVTGDATSLTIWTIKGDKVTEATTYVTKDGTLHEAGFQHGMPAPAESPPAGAGDGKSCGSCGSGGSCG